MPPESNPLDSDDSEPTTPGGEDDELDECRERIEDLEEEIAALIEELADHRSVSNSLHERFRVIGTAHRSSVVRIREASSQSDSTSPWLRDEVFTGWVYDEDVVVTTRLASDALEEPVVERPDGTVSTDPTVRTVDAGRHALSFFDVDTGDLGPLPQGSSAAVEDGDPVLGIYYRMRGRYPGRVMHLGTFADGDDESQRVEMTVQSGAPLFDQSGTVVGMVGQNGDVTPPADPRKWPLDRPDHVIQGFPEVNVEPVVPIERVSAPESTASSDDRRTEARGATDG